MCRRTIQYRTDKVGGGPAVKVRATETISQRYSLLAKTRYVRTADGCCYAAAL